MTDGNGRPREDGRMGPPGSGCATWLMGDRVFGGSRSSSSHECGQAQGTDSGNCGGNHPLDTPQHRVPRRGDQTGAHGRGATLQALSAAGARARGVDDWPTGEHLDGCRQMQTAGVSKRRRCEPTAEPRPTWCYPPAWMYLPHLGVGGGQELRPAAPCNSSSLHASADDTSYVAGAAAIRGRAEPPGTRRTTPPRACLDRVAASTDVATTGRPPGAATTTSSHGPRPSGAVNRAAERLAARNAGLAISLAHHAERVGMKDAKGRRAPELSAADRMAALRRRISERREPRAAAEPLVGTTDGVDVAQSAACEGRHLSQAVPASNEDDQIHQLHEGVGIRVTTAQRPCREPRDQVHHVVGVGEHGGHGDGARDSAPRHGGDCSALGDSVATATEAAAAQVAWHTDVAGVTNMAD